MRSFQNARPPARRAGAGTRSADTLEAREARLAFGVDLAAIEGLALLVVADDLIGGVQLRKARRRFRIVLIGVRVQLLGELTEGAFDLRFVRGLRNPQDLIGVAHRVSFSVKWSSVGSRRCRRLCVLMWGSSDADATRRRPLSLRREEATARSDSKA